MARRGYARVVARGVLAAATLCLPGGRAAAQEEPETADAGFIELAPRQMQAIERGLGWLARNQTRDGSWASEGSNGTYRMAMTGLVGLAFLSAGHVPGRGPYGAQVQKALEFVLKHQKKDGLLSTPEDSQSMYGHGFSMTFLAEAYGMDVAGEKREQIRKTLTDAVKLTARAQSSWGGWYYSPDSANDEGSVTITQVQALRACANVGITVPPKTMRQALDYIHKSQNPDGSIRYTARGGGGGSVALTAAGTELLLMAGQYHAEKTKKSVEYLKRNLNPNQTVGYHDMYTNFYGTQAMAQIGGRAWVKYYTSLRERLMRSQTGNGSWHGEIGSAYSTSLRSVAGVCL